MPAVDIAAALASLLQGGSPLLLKDKPAGASGDGETGNARRERESTQSAERLAEEDTETFRIEVGYVHGVKPGNIVGAIANVAGLEGRQIGHVDIREDHTFVGLPRGMPDAIMTELAKTRVAGRMLLIAQVDHVPPKPLRKPPKRPPQGKPAGARQARLMESRCAEPDAFRAAPQRNSPSRSGRFAT